MFDLIKKTSGVDMPAICKEVSEHILKMKSNAKDTVGESLIYPYCVGALSSQLTTLIRWYNIQQDKIKELEGQVFDLQTKLDKYEE